MTLELNMDVALRGAAGSLERRAAIQVMLENFEAVLNGMKFTVSSDTKLVTKIMHDVDTFSKTGTRKRSARRTWKTSEGIC